MRSMATVVGMALVALALSASAPLINMSAQAQNQPPVDDLPRQTTRAFAPFLRAILTHRTNVAERLFKVHRSVLTNLEQQEEVRILGRFNKPDQLELNLVGGRVLGHNMGILLFTVATEDGPVSFKIYYYGYGQDMYVARMDMSDDWDEIERLCTTVDILPVPITVLLGEINETGQ